MKTPLVKFGHLLQGPDQVSAAWRKAWELSRARGVKEPPPVRYLKTRLATKVHPDDVAALRAFCEQLTTASSDA